MEKGFHFIVDLVSVYKRIEQNDKFPLLPDGHRAISALAVTYTLVNDDYLRLASHGLGYKNIVDTMKSISYKKEDMDKRVR